MFLVLSANPAIDALVEIPPVEHGKVHRVLRENRYPGGKGVHVALALRELGAEVAILGFWAGPPGVWIRAECEKLGIKCYGPEIQGWTRTCQTFKSEDNFTDTEFLGIGPNFEPAAGVEFANLARELAGKSQVLIASGSLPPNAPVTFYRDIFKSCATEIKIGDFTGAPLTEVLRDNLTVLHLNQSESFAMTGGLDPARAALHFENAVELVAITAGKDGLFLHRRGEGTVHAQVEIPRVLSAVGSGDCLTAGIGFAIKQRLSLGEVARWGVACGAANCLRPELGMLHARDVQELLPKVKIQKVVQK